MKTNKTKEQIIEILIEEFEKVNKDYDDSIKNNNIYQERNFGRYIAIVDLLNKIKIYEK